MERVDEIYLKFEIQAISECYFTLEFEGDEKILLRETENRQTSRIQVIKTASVGIIPYKAPSQHYNN